MEYKAEAFRMFSRLLQNVRMTSISNLFRVEFTTNIEVEETDFSEMETNSDKITQSLENTGEFGVKGVSKVYGSDTPGRSIAAEKLGEKYADIGRNEKCPCGSEKKFKQCHGKNL